MTNFNDEIRAILEYIQSHWKNTIRFEVDDKDTLLGLPYPYTVPCQTESTMQNFFYWDTYFTNVGLLKHGFHELAKNNTDNLLCQVEKYGYIPNGNRTYFLNRSQPPYLSLIIRQVFDNYGDIRWLKSAFETWKKEYVFWMEKRMTPIGLNRHFHHATYDELIVFWEDVRDRLIFKPENREEILQISNQYLAEAETGWDFTPRFETHCADFIPVDLNSLLIMNEMNAAYFCEILKSDGKNSWRQRAEKRMQLVNQYCWNEEKGLYYDYDFIHHCHSQIASLATFLPLWANVASTRQAESVLNNLNRFEYDYGVSACENSHQTITYQWDYPNGWPPLFYITIAGLKNYGFIEQARRIAEKYVKVVIKNFKETGDLWEKYNVVDGSIQVKNEYQMPAMLGWTAGVFVFCVEFLRTEQTVRK